MTLKIEHDVKNRATLGKFRAKFEQNSSKILAKKKAVMTKDRGKVTLKIPFRQ